MKKKKKRIIYIKGLPFRFEKENGRWYATDKESKFTTIHSVGKTLKEAKENVRKWIEVSRNTHQFLKHLKGFEVREIKIRR